MATADDYGLSEMREEHRPRRVFRGAPPAELVAIVTGDGLKFRWHGPYTSISCHTDDAHQSIDAARRKALGGKDYIVAETPSGRIGLGDHERRCVSEHDTLRAAYAAVFGKESPHAQA